jgi:hypothetical protein
MGKNTKDYLKQIIISVIIGIVTGLGGAYVVVMKTQAANTVEVTEIKLDIYELKQCSDKKLNKDVFDYSLINLTQRLDRIENKIDNLKK